MALGIQVLKTVLAAAGVIVRSARFHGPTRQIIVDYTLHGQAQIKIIPFSEIEDLFTEAPARPPGAAPVDQRSLDGIPDRPKET